MAPVEEIQTAMVNRSIRTIKAELEYLCDASIITPHTLNDLLGRIPQQTALHAPISVGALPSAVGLRSEPPTSPMNHLNLNTNHNNNNNSHAANANNEKSEQNYFQPSPSPQPPPPSYSVPPPQASWPPLAQATALYAYTSADAGDLELQPNDHVTVTEYMNAEWWKGRSSRTGQEGIFPRSYVRVISDDGNKGVGSPPPIPQQQQQQQQQQVTGNNYGNAPLEVSGMGNGQGRVPGKVEEGAKKFGKKLGNAAIFGAGATMGADLVNSIF